MRVVRDVQKCVMQNRCAVFLCAIILILSSCPLRQQDLQTRHEELVRTRTGRELFVALLALDQECPGSLALKLDLGAHLLAAGELDQARVYLEAGEKLAVRARVARRGAGARDRRLAALLYADLAELSWRAREYREAADYASLSLSLDPGDPAGALFTRAKARAGLRANEESLADFAEGWESRPSTMVAEDYRVYWSLLSSEGRNGEALAVLAAFEARFPYEQGIGAAESLLYERTGRIEQSILAAFKELEYQRCAGSATQARMLACLEDLAWKLGDPGFDSGQQGKRLVASLCRYVKGDWPGALAELSTIASVSSEPFGRYLLLSARLEAGKATSEDLQSYLSLESRLRSLASYYHHLWRALKASRGPESASSAVEIVEKCILLAPRTDIAAEARQELGRIRGLTASDGERLLLQAELEQIARAVESGADVSLLEPVLDLLATPDNVYQAAGMRMLRALKADRRVRAFLEERQTGSAGRLKERLAFVLGD